MADESVEGVLARLSAFLTGHDHAGACHFWRQDGTKETCDCGLRTARQDVDRLALAHAREAQRPPTFCGVAIIADATLRPNEVAFISGGKRTVFAIDAAIAARQQGESEAKKP